MPIPRFDDQTEPWNTEQRLVAQSIEFRHLAST